MGVKHVRSGLAQEAYETAERRDVAEERSPPAGGADGPEAQMHHGNPRILEKRFEGATVEEQEYAAVNTAGT